MIAANTGHGPFLSLTRTAGIDQDINYKAGANRRTFGSIRNLTRPAIEFEIPSYAKSHSRDKEDTTGIYPAAQAP